MSESELSFDDVFGFIRRNEKDLRAFAEPLAREDTGSRFQRLKAAVEGIGNRVATRPPPLELYTQQWEQFASGKRSELDRGTVRYLCWEPKIAVGPAFLDYVARSDLELSPRSLQGLVYSCHASWDDPVTRSTAVAQVRKLVLVYEGRNRILAKWRSDIETILSPHGPEYLAERFAKAKATLKNWFEEWYLDARLSFARHMVLFGTERCRTLIGTAHSPVDTLFQELLPWSGWDPKEFKAQIGALILDREFPRIQNLLQHFILQHRSLGDPRLPRNRPHWLDIPQAAINRFVEVLCKEDIVFFFDHVLPTAHDRQKRKEFWLDYVSRYAASRPLLGYSDRVRLKPVLQQYKGGAGHFGELRSGSQSAFLLNFGDVVVVDFSMIGACFIYDHREFNKIVPDFWRKSEFTEHELRSGHYIARIVHLHTRNIDWRTEARQVLAAHGIRPGSRS